MAVDSVILVVDDDPVNVKLLTSILESEYEVLFALDGNKAIELAQKYHPDLILLDVRMPNQDGYQTCQLLHSTEATQDIPVIFISALNDQEDEEKGLGCGAIDYITKPINTAIVKSRVRNHLELKHARDLLKQQVSIDSLTNIANRRRFDEFMLKSWRTMHREMRFLCVIMIDIDYFKLFNDHYGHLVGDECLKKVASTMQDVILRPTDLLARYGGEEFACILPGTDKNGAKNIAEKLRIAVLSLAIPHEKSKVSEVVTISVGYSITIPDASLLYADFLSSADHALYQAKQFGRNKVACYSREGKR